MQRKRCFQLRGCTSGNCLAQLDRETIAFQRFRRFCPTHEHTDQSTNCLQHHLTKHISKQRCTLVFIHELTVKCFPTYAIEAKTTMPITLMTTTTTTVTIKITMITMTMKMSKATTIAMTKTTPMTQLLVLLQRVSIGRRWIRLLRASFRCCLWSSIRQRIVDWTGSHILGRRSSPRDSFASRNSLSSDHLQITGERFTNPWSRWRDVRS